MYIHVMHTAVMGEVWCLLEVGYTCKVHVYTLYMYMNVYMYITLYFHYLACLKWYMQCIVKLPTLYVQYVYT